MNYSKILIYYLKIISPFSNFLKTAIDLNIVVFPTPDGPKRQTISPCFSIVKLKSTTLFFLLAANVEFFISKKLS